MYFVDFHMHSILSPDARDSMADMAKAAAGRGVDCVCFTDHYDLDRYNTGETAADWFNKWPRSAAAYDEVCRLLPDMDIRMGMELGEANHRPEEAAAAVATLPDIDFVLGSIHNLRNTLDFYELPYESEEHCERLLDRYLEELLELAGLDFVQSIAHIGYTKRYMRHAGFSQELNTAAHGDRLEAIFRRLIDSGKALELNCSGYRDGGLHESIPPAPLLKLYRQMGGELISIGSDAHRTEHAGLIFEGYEQLRELGFRYVTIFKRRQPQMIKL